MIAKCIREVINMLLGLHCLLFSKDWYKHTPQATGQSYNKFNTEIPTEEFVYFLVRQMKPINFCDLV